jgi:hypothetical protein
MRADSQERVRQSFVDAGLFMTDRFQPRLLPGEAGKPPLARKRLRFTER